MHLYCVDGSNLVRCAVDAAGPAFPEREETDCAWLVEAFGELCRRLGPGVEFELYFDGPRRAWAGRSGGEPNLSVRFSHEEEADALILDRVRSRRWGGAGKVTVVTGDGELGRRTEEEGGRWQAVRHGTRLEGVLGSIEKRFSR